MFYLNFTGKKKTDAETLSYFIRIKQKVMAFCLDLNVLTPTPSSLSYHTAVYCASHHSSWHTLKITNEGIKKMPG